MIFNSRPRQSGSAVHMMSTRNSQSEEENSDGTSNSEQKSSRRCFSSVTSFTSNPWSRFSNISRSRKFIMFLIAVLLLVSTTVAATSRSWLPKVDKWHQIVFDNLVTFGDSYTGENRLRYFYDNDGQPPPLGALLPPNNSTSSGGIAWPRFVSTSTGAQLYNYAVNGAVCDNRIISRWVPQLNQPFPDVVYQVDAFVADTKYINETTNSNTLYTNRRAENTVYAIWIGTNDLGPRAFLTDSSWGGTTIPDYVDFIFEKFDKIYKAGGRYFVLINNAPLELSPLYGTPEAGALTVSKFWPDKPANISEVSSKMKQYTKLVNSIFTYRTPYEVLVAKRYPGASFAVFDVNALITDMYNNPTNYFPAPANVTGQYRLCTPSGSPCVDSDLGKEQFLWFDELHPSERTDEIIAEEFVRVVKGGSRYATYWK